MQSCMLAGSSQCVGMTIQHAMDVSIAQDVMAINQHPYEDKGCLLIDDVANLDKVRDDQQTSTYFM